MQAAGRAPDRRGRCAVADLDEARRAKDEIKAALAGRDGVAAVGIAREADGYGVLVRVLGDDASARRLGVPSSVHGVSVHVRATGPVTARR
ncbi:hypothetical protein J1G44_08625 [Cellulomonas sp. zg-ZUI199]|uniref:BON domain-containing protein n=1 Tax=Cellulomonas wangleii TaxID=2816956 RepID=A0ABX8D9U2_9CELL|nr:hypothetical protein [Cellulomonas wangleii]QVI62532.1 hypothetical protein KG103_00805 [Cellulomonas wangleii]